MRLRKCWWVVIVAVWGCADQRTPTSTAVQDIGETATLLDDMQPEGYWRLGDIDTTTMLDQSSQHIDGQYFNGVLLGQEGALAADPDRAATFDGSRQTYAEVPDHKVLSLTRVWDDFPGDYSGGDTWGVTPTGEQWKEQVSQTVVYGVSGDGTAYIDPGGESGTFEQGLPSTSLLHGQMQIRATWNAHPSGGALQPVVLVAQWQDPNNMVRAELIEHEDHRLEIALIKVVDGANDYLSRQYIDTAGDCAMPATYNIGDWWYLRFEFDGPALSARAWKMGTDEPTCWQATGTAASANPGSVAVRSANSASDVRPIVQFDDFWVQTIGLSISLFVKVDRNQPSVNGKSETFVMGKGDAVGTPVSSGNEEYYLRYHSDTGHLKFYTFNLEDGYGAGQDITDILNPFESSTGATLDPGKWYYLVLTLDPGDFHDPVAGVSAYVNGRYRGPAAGSWYRGDNMCPGACVPDLFDNETHCHGGPNDGEICWTITPHNGDAPFRIGTSAKDVYFSGSVDEVAIYGRRLGCEEVRSVYNASCQPTDAPLSGLFATASSSSPGDSPNDTIDGSLSTSWSPSSNNVPQWISVDLGSVRDVAGVRLWWGAAYAAEYQVQVSSDDLTWLTVANVTNGDGGIDYSDIAKSARYVRVFATPPPAGYSLQEFQVFTCSVAPLNCSNDMPVAVVGAPQIVFPGQQVTLDGSQSFDSDPFDPSLGPPPLTYAWNLAAPTGSTSAIQSPNTATPTLTPDTLGTYAATLVVTDSAGASSFPASTYLTVVPPSSVATAAFEQAIAIVATLTTSDVAAPGNLQSFSSLLNAADADFQRGNMHGAANLISNLIARTDGWSMRGAPDLSGPGRDWIVSEGPAKSLYVSLSSCEAALQAM